MMKYIGAYLLCVLGGTASPTSADVSKVLTSVGVEIESEKLDAVITQMSSKSLDELISEGTAMFAKTPGGGAAAPAASGAAGASAPAADAPKAAEPEPEEEADEDMGFDLFD
mmetsp:Transcript_12793/g.23009  ORF Transcript_12793/g.23009 Transcript_12793/m.23009 type:complete len:112 (+) Transcript_12793:64-399(+)